MSPAWYIILINFTFIKKHGTSESTETASFLQLVLARPWQMVHEMQHWQTATRWPCQGHQHSQLWVMQAKNETKWNDVKRPKLYSGLVFLLLFFVSHDNYSQSVHRLNSESYTIIHILAIESCVVFLCFISGCFHCELTPWFSLVRFLPFLIVHHFDVPCPFISKCYWHKKAHLTVSPKLMGQS